MQNVSLAIEQFATENPLRAVYDRRGQETFGKYPPYQLANWGMNGSVARIVERDPPAPGGGASDKNRLAARLARDLGYRSGDDEADWVQLGTETNPNYPDGHDDNRALYAYLKVFSPGSMNLIPEERLKPLDPQSRDYVNPNGGTGSSGTPGDPGTDWVDVLGIHDAWGVPLDYMLYVKCEWRLPVGGTNPRFVITERRPVLRSRGIERDVYDAWVLSKDKPTERERRLSPPDKWLFSEELPRPWAALADSPYYRDGRLVLQPGSSGASSNGWLRAVALEDDYAYRPDGDDVEESP
jgi:hypothetical protein